MKKIVIWGFIILLIVALLIAAGISSWGWKKQIPNAIKQTSVQLASDQAKRIADQKIGQSRINQWLLDSTGAVYHQPDTVWIYNGQEIACGQQRKFNWSPFYYLEVSLVNPISGVPTEHKGWVLADNIYINPTGRLANQQLFKPSNIPKSYSYVAGNEGPDILGWVNQGDFLTINPKEVDEGLLNPEYKPLFKNEINQRIGLGGAIHSPSGWKNRGLEYPEQFIDPGLSTGALIIKLPGKLWQVVDRKTSWMIEVAGEVKICRNSRARYFYRNKDGNVQLTCQLEKANS